MSRRKAKHFHQRPENQRPMPKAEALPKASKIFDKYHARAMYYRLPIAAIPAFGTWACAKAGVGGEFMTSYGADIGGPLAMYVCGRAIYHFREWSDLEKTPIIAEGAIRPISNSTQNRGRFAAGLFLACTGMEIGQYFHIGGGTFDPKDILAFGAGITLALLFEKAVEPKPAKKQ